MSNYQRMPSPAGGSGTSGPAAAVSRVVIDPADTYAGYSYSGTVDVMTDTTAPLQYLPEETRDWLTIGNSSDLGGSGTADKLLLGPGFYSVVTHWFLTVTTPGSVRIHLPPMDQAEVEGATYAVGDHCFEVTSTYEFTEQTEVGPNLTGTAEVTQAWFEIQIVRLGDIPNP